MTQKNQSVFSPTDVQELLNVDSSTLRKYAILLENQGYKFHKNKRGHRGYFDKDVIALKKLVELSEQRDMTLERSAKAVMTWVNTDNVTLTVMEEEASNNELERYSDMLERLKRLEEYSKQQEDFNRRLLEELNKRDDYIRKRDEERDANLTHLIRESLETKKLIASTVEEAKKTWWQKLFK